eukprot:12240608-Alexandrium_andersonii.AAC.1
MSASLVGSEMCIRDRLYTPLGGVARRGQEHSSGLGVCHPDTASCPQRESCLLYTSDAADDM